MDVQIQIYGDIPSSLLLQLDQDLDSVNQILIGENLDLGQMLPEEDLLPVISLTEDVWKKILELKSSVIGDSQLNPSDEISALKLKTVRDILDEQLSYIYDIEPEIWDQALNLPSDCQKWFIVAYLNGYPYGGIFMFWNEQSPSSVLIQGISKFLIPSLMSLLYPEESKIFPKLNSLLDPVIQSLAKKLGATNIYVVPLGKQGQILEKYYQYHPVEKVIYPCSKIRDASSVLSTPSYRKIYSKNLDVTQ